MISNGEYILQLFHLVSSFTYMQKMGNRVITHFIYLTGLYPVIIIGAFSHRDASCRDGKSFR